ncbi:MAG: cupin domain-containing protein [Sphingobium sp.]
MSHAPFLQLVDFDTATFLRDYWQQRPLLIRNPWASWANPLDPDELAGLACEEGVESRLILGNPDGLAMEGGPFPDTRFGTLGERAWTLLVQAVDHHVPAVADLIEPFRFIPNWRIDDVMVSYAADEGGVGPHFDQYDVFLVQGLGRRRWQVGGLCDQDTPLLPHDDLRLLADFEATDEWVLEPGDILYVPPRFAHNGVAVGEDCMTYSIGFRAPARSELIAHWCDHLLTDMDDDDRYGDARLVATDNPGEIPAAALDRLHAMVSEALGNRAAFARWFGQYNSVAKYPDMGWQSDEPLPPEEVRAAVSKDGMICRNPASRFAFIRESDDLLLLFADGRCFECRGDGIALGEQICAHPAFMVDADLSDDAMALIGALIDQGSLAFDDGDEED